MTKAKAKRIEDPFVLHEGQFYVLPDWYSGKLTNRSVLTLHPLNCEETERLVSFQSSSRREAYAFILPMVQRRGLSKVKVDDDDEGEES